MPKELIVTWMDKLCKLDLTVKILLVLSLEFAPAIVILMILPFDGSSIQLYELFIFGELLTVLLLKPWNVFFVAILNSLFIAASLLFQSHTMAFSQDLRLQFWSILLRPITVQFMIALISYLWVTYMNAVIQRAQRAEIKAAQDYRQAERLKEMAEQNTMILKNSVENIVYKHATLMNHGLFTKLPLTDYEPMLWPLINAFNSLQSRLQHTYQIEHELQDLMGAISMYVELIHDGKFLLGQPSHTHTALDMLLNSLCETQKALSRPKASSSSLWNIENATTLRLKIEDIWITHSQELYLQRKQINCDWDSSH